MKFYITVAVFCSLLIPNSAQAAYLFFDPSSSNSVLGNDFIVNVFLNSESVSANAVGGAITVKNKNLEILQVNTTESILNLWTVKPTVSDSVIRFEGLILNPGYAGAKGHLFSIKLRPQKSGSDQLVFSDSSILANDGKGTNILSKNKDAFFSVSSPIDPLDMKIVRVAGSKTVYFIKNDRRYIFLNEKIYKTWFADFSSVEIIDEKTLAHYLIGGFVKPRPNVLMFKITTDPRVYLVSDGGELRWIVNETVARSIFGSGWARQIIDITDGEIAGFSLGKPIYSKNELSLHYGDLSIVE